MTETIDPSYAGEGIYRENILDHYKNPRNSGVLINPTFSFKEFNPLCGDEITFYVKLNGEKTIENLSFLGKGCAISQSSASMLAETIIGKTLDEAKKIQREDILEMLSIPIGPVRIKCAMLGLVALKKGINLFEKTKSDFYG